MTSSPAALEIRLDDLTGEPTRALIAAHLSDMRSISPEESCHALDLSGLQQPSVQVWSAWLDGELAGVGALAQLDAANGELKSMRVADSHRGEGIGRAMLEHLIGRARQVGMSALWLETGSTPEFFAAQRLYESAGFVRCEPFGSYVLDPYSVFMTKKL
ncbi:GNAT family N-acetyltransferase [Microbacterium schleiferi]|uniref:GNAT family N-acetyltransferase n=1 Tax=Microbacterium schleiferi TaxID=69362 RepID=UPI00311E5323